MRTWDRQPGTFQPCACGCGDVYTSAEWKALRRKVFARDGAVCAECGEIRDLHLHHVEPWAGHPELRHDPSNIIVLCRKHHHAAHRKEVLL